MKKPFVLSLLLLLTIYSLPAQNEVGGTLDGKFFTSFDGTKIYYEVKGEGKPVILVHGFIVNSESWKKTALYNDLLANGYKVILLDQRGNGRSDKPHTPEAYENDTEAKDIMALTKALGVKNYCAVGYSRGAIIVSRLLVIDKNASAVVMGGMGADFINADWPRRIMFYEALMGKPVKELEGLLKYVKDSGLDTLALAYMQNGQPSTSREEFAKNKKPVLVICGSEDEDNGSSKALAALIPVSDYIRVPGNHNSTSQTQEFSYAVITFIKKLK